MQRCQVLIVGGGPAGSSCARRLQQAGIDTLLLDKQRFPRDKTCAGWVTPPVLDLLEFDPSEYRHGRVTRPASARFPSVPVPAAASTNEQSGSPSSGPPQQKSESEHCRERVFQPITGFRTGQIGGDVIETRYDRPVSYGIRRCEFDHYLLERSDAPLRLGESLRSMERQNGIWTVNGEIQAALVVGAGGHFCPVARNLGGHSGRRASVVAAQEIEFLVPPDELDRVNVEAEVPELFFCKDLGGYGWCFRKGDYLNIGLGRLDKHQLSTHVARFCSFLRERGKVACDIPSQFHGHAYLLYERIAPRLLDDGVLLIGDAAGLAYPQSGEGIRPAVESGIMAANVIVEADGDYRTSRLEPYRDRVAARFGKPRGSGPAEWLPAGWLHYFASRLLANKWFSRHVLLDRWFLHAHEPALSP